MRHAHTNPLNDQRERWARVFEVTSASVILILLTLVMILVFSYHAS